MCVWRRVRSQEQAHCIWHRANTFNNVGAGGGSEGRPPERCPRDVAAGGWVRVDCSMHRACLLAQTPSAHLWTSMDPLCLPSCTEAVRKSGQRS